VFRVNHPGALGGDGMTQFGRALRMTASAQPCHPTPARQ